MLKANVEVVSTNVHATSPTRETAPEVQKLIAEGRRDEAIKLMEAGGRQVQVRASGDGADVQFLVPFDSPPKVGERFEITIVKVPELRPVEL